jgi:hypothetical protein
VRDFAGHSATVCALLFIVIIAFVTEVVHAGTDEYSDLDWELALRANLCVLLIPHWVSLYHSQCQYPQNTRFVKNHLRVIRGVVGVLLLR